MFMADSRSRVWLGASPSLRKADDPALLDAEIVHADAGSLRELLPQQRSKPFDPRFDRVDAHPHRVTGDDQPDLAGDEAPRDGPLLTQSSLLIPWRFRFPWRYADAVAWRSRAEGPCP
jgi:hypothetical protein